MAHVSPVEHPGLLERVVERLAALADPVRLRILHHLRTNGETTVNGLVGSAGVSQPSVSRHLATLRQAGLVAVRREGNQAFYAVRDESVFDICNVLCRSVMEHARENESALLKAGRRSVRSRG